ncbi:hypothetical protein NA56DRAFT_742915 [Hyaloscypha hepaticicola]|uniref:Uncharacterized protein n=1 Tax=Hyaloscypha hepaticicola TaxID=2082293 RepID=A0A2J6QMU6_9HELO|nr:hypothetical protein NA56DRAFT_742915 [Hyaloscypha hepaticicola]
MAKATTATVRPTCHFGPATGQLCRRILKRGIHTLSRMRKVRSRISQTKKRDVEMSKTVPCQIGSYWRIGWGTYQENDSSVKGGVGIFTYVVNGVTTGKFCPPLAAAWTTPFLNLATAGRSDQPSTVFSHRGSSKFSVIGTLVEALRCQPALVIRAIFQHWGIQEMEDYRLGPLSIPCMTLAGNGESIQVRTLITPSLAVFTTRKFHDGSGETFTVFAIMRSAGISERKSPEPPKCFANRPHRCIFASSSRALLLCFQFHHFTFHHCLGRPSVRRSLNGKSQIRQFLAQKGCLAHGYIPKPGARHAELGWRRANCCRSPRNPPYATRPKVFESTAICSRI